MYIRAVMDGTIDSIKNIQDINYRVTKRKEINIDVT